MSLKDKLFSFDGRLRRLDWWLLTIAVSVVYVLIVTVLYLLLPASVGFLPGPKFGDPLNELLAGFAIHAPLLFIHCALAAKRAHDRDKSARLVILLVLATTATSYLPDDAFASMGRMADQGAVWAWPFMLAGAVNIAVSLYLLIVLGFRDGTPGPNRFGPSPKDEARMATSEPDSPIREPGPAA
jgi:uncharacterized membrane protein YhaH (DUF805 family)